MEIQLDRFQHLRTVDLCAFLLLFCYCLHGFNYIIYLVMLLLQVCPFHVLEKQSVKCTQWTGMAITRFAVTLDCTGDDSCSCKLKFITDFAAIVHIP